MRDTVWRLPHHWLVAIDDGDRATALKPPADAFFDTVIELSLLPIERLLAMLHKRTDEPEPMQLSQIAADAGGNPRAAIRAANAALVDGADPTEDLSARARLLGTAGRQRDL